MSDQNDQLDRLVARFESGQLSRRQFVIGLLASAGAVSLAACGPTAAPPAAASASGAAAQPQGSPTGAVQPKKGGVLKYGLSTDPPNFDPHYSTGAAADTVKAMIYNGLLTHWRGGKIIPELAESYQLDGKDYVFKLRQGVRFHNGDELTSEDVKYSIERIKDPKVAAFNAGNLGDVERVDTPDKYTARLVMKKVNSTIPAVLAMSASFIVSKKYSSDPKTDLKTQPLGTGPFKFVERQPGVSVKLTKFNDFWIKDQPYLDGITYIPYADDTARVIALRTGAVDLIDYVPFKDMVTIEADKNLFLTSDKQSGYGWLGFRVERPPFNDVKVRQALSYALDRQAIMETAFSGRGKPMTGGLIPESFVGYTNLEGRYTFDPGKAKRLLAEAGFAKPSDLKFQLLSTSTYTVISKPAEAVHAQLKALGVDVELVLQEWLTFRQTVQAGTFPAHVWGSAPSFLDPDFLSQQLESSKLFAPQLGFKDDQLDQWFADGRAEPNADKRTAIYKKIEERVLDLVPWTYLVRREQAEAGRSFVKGYEHIPVVWSSNTLRETWLDK